MALQAGYINSGSFRHDEQYKHGLFNLQVNHTMGTATGRTSLAYARLDQDTAGFILGEDSYKDPVLREQNLNPEAFREGWAFRLSSLWDWQTDSGHDLELIPYVRSSRMDFLQHFLPATPREENGQDSAGLLFSWSHGTSLSAGADLDWAEGMLVEFQQDALETGSAFLQATRPQGYHYDYEVRALTVAAWAQWQSAFGDGWEFTAGLRAEHLKYDYDNHMLTGNTRDNGSECGFGGCLYTRPADRSDSFSNLSPELGLSLDVDEENLAYLRVSCGYRAPQATELYRLQSGQLVSDFDSETLDAVEIGLKGVKGNLTYEVAVYTMKEENFIFRDANGFNISDGKTRHRGIEALLRWQVTDHLLVSGNLSWAQHEYDFNRNLARGEVIVRGNEIDTAPPWLGGLRVYWQADERKAMEAEWVYQGDYCLDAANAHGYPGHSLLNLRGWVAITEDKHRIAVRLTNLLDNRYAERADFAFGNYHYFPGAGRRVFLEWQYRH